MACPGIDVFEQLVAGRLSTDERARVADHAGSCPDCRQLVDALVTRDGGGRAIEIGGLIGGRFRIDRVVGTGGMGVVVAATHVELGTRVAIKLMRAELLHHAGLVERFIREARAVARLRTEHVCKVIDVARLETGAPYIVMELLEGRDLGGIRTRLPPATAVAYVLQACIAVAEAHAAGIIHRDLKPANLFVVGDSLVKVLDFGIAKVLDSDAGLTRTRAVVGSPGYMSPEQLRSARDVDARSDIWALGVTLYELLSGRLPFPGASHDEIASKVASEPPASLDVDPALAAVVLRCLEKAPEQRYPSVAALVADLVPFGGAAAHGIADALGEALAVAATVIAPEPVAQAIDSLVGRRLGEFVLRERIGEGGFGAVYRATQAPLDREAVVKVLHATHATERFLREARLASKLDHPYAAHVYAFGAERDGVLWIAMELVRGTPLDQVLKLHGPLPLERFVPLLDRICEVVHTAHEQGIVHRDIKPANLMILSRAGRLLPKLLDLGIAKGGGAEPAAGITRHGAIVGSPLYMAPEQWTDAGQVEARTDLYALGILAFECLTGKPPFRAASYLEVAEAHAKQAVPALGPQFPPALDAVFAKMLAKRASDRHADALELAAAFRKASGIPHDPTRLPALDPAVRDAAINDAPQPIAEAVAGYEAARNPHHARDAVALAARVIVRYLALLAITCRSRIAGDAAGVELLRTLVRRPITDAEWLELARQLTSGWAGRRDAYPIPELVDALADRALLADVAALLAVRDATAGEDGLIELLAASADRLGRVLSGVAFCRHYTLAVAVEGGLAERWMGARRMQRSTTPVRGKPLPEGTAVLLDADGAPVIVLAPLFAIAAPAPGAAPELFLFEGRDRRGARFVALPAGFEHHDDAIWDWFRSQLADTLDHGQPAVGEEEPPYRGLSAFSVDDSARFFGREKQVDAFVNRLRLQPLLAVVGRSGAGKSSFVHAGVIPALPAWRAITLRPGPAPLASLTARLEHAGIAAALPHRGALGEALRADAAARGPIVLVIDQLEELFTLCDDADERRRFAEAIAAAARSTDDPVRVVFTLRDDFLVRTEQVPALRNRISQGLQLLTVPVADDLLRILVEPARRAGYEFDDPTLATEMVADVADQPGALALLSFTAAKLWALRDRHFKQLTRAAYKTLGGVGGALARHADQTLEAMPADERTLTREAFRHLVTSQHTRAVLGRRELRQLLGDNARADSVIEQLVAARLLVASETETGGETIEIIHEALLAAWPRLVEWQREDSEGARFREQLRSAATQWHERGQPRGLLWRGDPLADYTRWRARHPGPLTDAEAGFATASAREAARTRRNRGLLVIAGFAALATIAVVLLVSKHRLQNNLRDQWETRGQRDLLDGKPLEALVELAHAGELGAGGRVHDFLIAEAVSATDGAQLTLVHGAEVRYPRFSHDDTRVITGSIDNIARIWDARTGKLLHELPTGGAVARTGFSPDDTTVLTASLDGTVRQWDVATGKELRRFTHGGGAWCALYLPDGKTALTAGDDGVVALWDLATGAEKLRIPGEGGGVHACAISPDGALFAAGDSRGVTRLWDARTGALLHRHAEQTRAVLRLAFSPDASRLLASAAEPIAYEWSTTTGAVVHRFEHADSVYAASFSPDGKRILTASLERLAFVWDAETGQKLVTFTGHTAGITNANWSPDGRYIATASEDRSARLWSAATGRQLASWQRHGEHLFDVSFAHDGQHVVTASNDKTAIIWDARPQQPTLELATPAGTYWAAFSRDGARALLATSSGIITVWNTVSGARLADLGKPGERRIIYAAFDATANRIAAVSEDDVVRIWDGQAERPAREIKGPTTTVEEASWSPDGRSIAVAADDGYLRVWDAASGALQFETRVKNGVMLRSVVFSPDGETIATSTGDAIQLWDRDGHPRPAFEDRDQLVGLAYAPHGRRVLLRTAGPMAKIRDLDTGAEVKLLGHVAAVTRMAWHPDGHIVATGALDGTARLWDAETGTELAVVTDIGHEVSVAFAPDGRLLVAGDNGTTMITALPRYTGTAAELQHLIACRVPFEVADDQVRPRERARTGCDGI